MDVLVVCSKINLASNSIGALEALDKGCKTIQCIRGAIGYFQRVQPERARFQMPLSCLRFCYEQSAFEGMGEKEKSLVPAKCE